MPHPRAGGLCNGCKLRYLWSGIESKSRSDAFDRPATAARRPALERLEDYVLMTTYTVINTLDHGGSVTSGSFRYCWDQVAQGNSPGTIDFDIPTSDPGYNSTTKTWTISFTQDGTADPSGKLLTMGHQVTVDAWTQGDQNGVTNYQGAPLIVINGSQVPGINALDLGGSGASVAVRPNSVIEGLSIVNFSFDPSTLNGGDAIIVEPTSPGVQILGNYLGVLPDGVTAAGNGVAGVAVDAVDVTIGGTSSVDRNIISGNTGAGIAIATLPSSIFGFPVGGVVASGDLIEGNFIGTDASGETALPNGYGVALGGTMSASVIGNVISGNTNDGIVVTSNSFGTVIPAYNSFDGIAITLPDEQASGNLIELNTIGSDVNQSIALPNGGAGIDLLGTTTDGNTETVDHTAIGGPVGKGNLIAGNTGAGILLQGALTTLTTIAANDIGGPPGHDIPNGGSGVDIINGANNNTIGANSSLDGNFIAYNTGNGVTVGTDAGDTAATGNTIEGNEISFNTGQGIDLGNDGPTVNDASGHAGPDDFQNYPALTSAIAAGASTTITGAFDEADEPNTTLRIDFFGDQPSEVPGDPAGQIDLGSTEITTDANGHAAISATVQTPLTGYNVSAMATVETTTAPGIAVGNTSEFSADIAPTPASPPAGDTTSITSLTINASPGTANQPSNFIVAVADTTNNAAVPMGEVDIFANGSMVASGDLDGGTATIPVTLAANTYSVTANYVGDSGFNGSTTPTSTTYVVNPAAPDSTSINLNTSPSPGIAGQPTTFMVTVADTTNSGATPIGKVDIDNGSTVLGSVSLDGGTATILLTLPPGPYSITAVYLGSSGFQEVSTTPALSYVVNAPTADATTVGYFNGPEQAIAHQPFVFVVGVQDLTNGSTIPTGEVDILANGNKIGSGDLNTTTGLVGITVPSPSLPAGMYSITANYLGNSSFQPTNASVNFTVFDTASVSFTVDSPPIANQPIIVTATVGDTMTPAQSPRDKSRSSRMARRRSAWASWVATVKSRSRPSASRRARTPSPPTSSATATTSRAPRKLYPSPSRPRTDFNRSDIDISDIDKSDFDKSDIDISDIHDDADIYTAEAFGNSHRRPVEEGHHVHLHVHRAVESGLGEQCLTLPGVSGRDESGKEAQADALHQGLEDQERRLRCRLQSVTITLAKPFKGPVQVTIEAGLEAADGATTTNSISFPV